MALQQSKMSKMKKRMRKGANRYRGIQTSVCAKCGAARIPHRLCVACGTYAGRQVLATDNSAK